MSRFLSIFSSRRDTTAFAHSSQAQAQAHKLHSMSAHQVAMQIMLAQARLLSMR